jgi:CRISPR-associated protein Cas1
VVYCGKRLTWDTVIFRKCQELARYLLGEVASLDFTSPRPVLERSDTRMLREKILSLSQSQGSKLGIGKSTLHYLRENAESGRPFRVCGKVRVKLEAASV